MLNILIKKTTCRLISTCLAILAIANSSGFAFAFSDISDNYKYSPAINYLAQKGIINGYPDGTFQPDRNVSRVEFLKILLESSGITTDINTPSGFSDIDETAWYARYVRKAAEQKWIEGYPDGTFKPEQSINKVEALKITAKVQQWKIAGQITTAPFLDSPALSWFAPYVDYAKNRNYLEENGKYFIPDAILSRAKVSEILFRAYVTENSNADKYSSTLTKTADPSLPTPEPQPSTVGNAVTYKTYPPDLFSNVQLNESFPNIFYLNEVYFFEGIMTGNYHEKAFIFLVPENETNVDNYINYISTVDNKGDFKIPVIFRKTGNYKLGLILGTSGESKVVDISVLPSLPQNPSLKNTDTPTSLNVVYDNQKTTLRWNNGNNDLTELDITQGKEKATFIFRQNIESFDVDYTDFKKMKEGNVQYRVKGARLKNSTPLEINSDWAVSTEKTFTAANHAYTHLDPDSITLDSFPDTLSQVKDINFSGKTEKQILREAAVIRPDGTVVTFMLSSNKSYENYYDTEIITPGSTCTFNYSPDRTGVYILEINNPDGEAVLNLPVYISTGIPLIPNYFDLNSTLQKEENFNLTNSRQKLLELINEERNMAGLSNVIIDGSLNNLAQLHSEDMVKRNFFGHVNPDGKNPNDRRLKLLLPTPVGENLANAPGMLYAHYGLMQSAIHRENILNAKWTRVGIGIAQNESGNLLITEEFSTNPYNEADLQNLRNNILNDMNEERNRIGITQFSLDSTLNSLANQWSSKMVDENFFDFISPNGITLSGTVINSFPNRAVQAIILQSNSDIKLTEEILQGDDSTQNQWERVGIGLKVDNLGTLNATMLYTTR